jgi:hypothetical protein
VLALALSRPTMATTQRQPPMPKLRLFTLARSRLAYMDLREIRKLMLVAVASDDVLVDQLVLKGGNALELIYKMGDRASRELDFSMEGDFEDVSQIEGRLLRALTDRFDAAGFVLFDFTFGRKPATSSAESRWGGYVAEFKVIEREKYNALGGNTEAIRRQSQVSDSKQGRIFRIEISKYEFCHGKREAEVDQYTCYVYTPQMIAAEKFRAICQQMSSYELRRHPTARARDFYDIHTITASTGLDVTSPEFVALVREVFRAKEVPIELLGQMSEYREFHRHDWPAVQDAVRGAIQDFDFYFEFVLERAARLQKALGDI